MLTLAKTLCWTFRQLLLPSSAKDKKMQMSNGVLIVHTLTYIVYYQDAVRHLHFLSFAADKQTR